MPDVMCIIYLVVVVELAMRFKDELFTEGLNNPNSPEYKAKAKVIIDQVGH